MYLQVRAQHSSIVVLVASGLSSVVVLVAGLQLAASSVMAGAHPHLDFEGL